MSHATLPDEQGHFGIFGGRYVPETLMTALDELLVTYEQAKEDPAFQKALRYYLTDYVGLATPLYYAAR